MDSLTIFFVASNIFSIALLCVGMIYTYKFVNWSMSSIKLSERNILAYKGLLVEVIESTSMNIKYKVVRGFK